MKIKKRFIASFAALTILSISIFGSLATEVETAGPGPCHGSNPCRVAD